MSDNPAIRLEFPPGTDIESACAGAVRLADQLLCDTVFTFNSVHVHARPGVDPMALVNAWDRELHSGGKVKLAMVAT